MKNLESLSRAFLRNSKPQTQSVPTPITNTDSPQTSNRKSQTQLRLKFTMRTLLALLAFIMFFFSREITLIQEMVFNLRASLHERIMDVAFPSLLLVSFVTGIYFIYLIPFPRGWMRWMAILVLCLIYQLGAQNQALFRPRYLSLSLFLMFLLLFDVVVCHSIWFMD